MTTTILPVRVSDPIGSPAAEDLLRTDLGGRRSAPRRTGRPGPRTDIQALRAIAVTLVLVYHLWPDRLTGGFVGVDVFFVVSGFLITAHLLNRPPRSARDIAGFWARRIRRLLPAALLVLAVTLIASRILAPETQWFNTAKQAAASALYVENWLLAGDSVDYLAAGAAPTAVQHFWSLSVEEQFYLVWPLLIALLTVIALRRSWPRAVMAGLLAVVVASLTASIVYTVQSPASAYFVTPTRAWEFGLGGLLAAIIAHRTSLPPDPRRVRLTDLGRGVFAGLGLVAIGFAAVTFNETTPFPGWWALIPTLGAVAVLAAMPTAEIGPFGRALAVRPVQWLGDVSYSVYLWHWPLIVLLPFVVGGRLGLVDKLAIVCATLLLAVLTKRFVEDRYRHPRVGVGVTPVFAAAAVGMVFILILAAVQVAEIGVNRATAQRQLEEASGADNDCFGAGSLAHPRRCRDATFDAIVPSPAQAIQDRTALSRTAGSNNCWAVGPDFAVVRCHVGDPNAKRTMALVGNSHAGQWLPALEEVAQRDGWRITTFVASRCAMVPVDQTLPTKAQGGACRRWTDAVSAEIEKDDYDLVVLTNRLTVPTQGAKTLTQSLAAYQSGYENLLEGWSKVGVRTLLLRDTPAPGNGGISSIPNCVATYRDDVSRCSGSRQDWVPDEPLADAMKEVRPARMKLADLNGSICGPSVCSAVVGGVLVYMDGSHLTATYSRTLATPLAKKIKSVMKKA